MTPNKTITIVHIAGNPEVSQLSAHTNLPLQQLDLQSVGRHSSIAQHSPYWLKLIKQPLESPLILFLSQHFEGH